MSIEKKGQKKYLLKCKISNKWFIVVDTYTQLINTYTQLINISYFKFIKCCSAISPNKNRKQVLRDREPQFHFYAIIY